MSLNHRMRWVALAVAFVAVSTILLRRPDATAHLMRSAASSPVRPVEGRLTGVPYSPRKQTIDERDLASVHAAAGAFLSGRDRDPHTSATAMLLYGKTSTAVIAFEKLATEHADDANVWSDLAAARLQDGLAANDAHMMARALAAADHALAVDPVHEAALFNRGLALDALGLRFAATAAWRHYLLADATSGWAAEARERLRASDVPTRDAVWAKERVRLDRAMEQGDTREIERIVKIFPMLTRGLAEGTYLAAWGDAFLAGDVHRARQMLAGSREIAAALKNLNGDGLLDAAVRALDAADEASLQHTARGFHAYGQARVDNAARRVAESFRGFVEAEREFTFARNPMQRVATYFRGNALIDLGDAAAAETIASDLESRLDPSYRSLRGYLLWLRGRLANNAGRHYESLLAHRAAREIFEQLGELDNADRLRTAEAAMLARLGRDQEAWQLRRLALAGAAASGKWNLVETAIEGIARDEIEGPDRDVARSLFKVQVRAPSALPLMRFNGLLWLAYLDGLHDTTAARNAAARIPDAKQRADSMDELRLAQALAAREYDPVAAERMFGEVIDYRTRAGLWPFVPAIYVQRARLRRAMSRDAEAEADLRASIDLIESRRIGIRNDTLRDAFLGHSTDAYTELGDLLLDRGDWQGAFDVSERARARVLMDHVGRDAMSLAEIAAATPPEVVGAHYTSFDSRTLVVVIERGRSTHFVINVGRAELEKLRGVSADASRKLYDLLIAPFRDRLGPDRLLVIAPDDATYGIPFAALRAPDGRFLIEETAIALAPAGAAIASAPPVLRTRVSNVTIVADPAFSTTMFPHLERLPAARDDAKRVKSMFARATTLVAEEATLRALVSAARESDAVHIAAHAFSSSRDASLSLFALAREDGNEGALYLPDVERLELPRRPLVVLAGCETGSFGAGKGSIRSLAHAFLAAGSSSVLATLWDVDDERTSELTAAFYRSLSTGATVPTALRDAQLTVLRTHRVHEWSAFQIHLGVPGKMTYSAPLTH